MSHHQSVNPDYCTCGHTYGIHVPRTVESFATEPGWPSISTTVMRCIMSSDFRAERERCNCRGWIPTTSRRRRLGGMIREWWGSWVR